jgi:hypothetical protein
MSERENPPRELVEIQPVPPRPWGIQETHNFIRVGSLASDGRIDESVFWIDLKGAHRPTELARARFIVETINKFAP